MDTATLVGRVVDASGVVIAGARVELIDIDRNTKSTVQTNRSGIYAFPNARPGHYRATVSAPGYRTAILPNLTMYVQDDIQQNFRLISGAALESVTMQTDGTPVETTGAVGTVVEQELVKELPLNGRSFQTLFQLTPGIVIAPTNFASQGQFSVNGQRTNTNYFIVDGASANVGIAAGLNPGQSSGGSLPAVTAFGGTNSLVSTDDVQEFAVLTSNYSPEFGRMPGGQVTIVTRSGTNEFHGEAFEYLRNDAFDANDWFANRDHLARAALRQNDFGGVLGGPILKTKTFGFLSYEALRLRQPNSKETDVPSSAARNTSPLAIKPFLNAYPLPNGPDEGNGLARANYAYSDPSGLDAVSVRIDHHASDSLFIFARYTHSTSDREQRATATNSLSTVTSTHFALQTLTAGITYRLSSNFISDFRLNWSGSTALSRDGLDDFGGAVPFSPQLVFPPSTNQGNGVFQFVPALGPQNVALSLGRNIRNTQNQINFVGNQSFQIDTHSLKWGIDVRRLTPKTEPANYLQSIFFRNIQAVLAGTSFFSILASNLSVESVFQNVSAYAQDGWKPSSRINVILGLRWDYNPTPKGHATNGLQPFALANANDVQAFALAAPGTPIYRVTLNNFAPRLGVAYELRDSSRTQTVIKSAVGMFYDLGNGPAGNAFDGNHFPFSAQKDLVGAPFPLSPADASPPSISIAPPFPMIAAFPAKLKLPYTAQWNLMLQQQLGEKQRASISYIGSAGHGLLRTEQYVGGVFGVPQDFTQVLFTNNAGYSRYDALQIQFQRTVTVGIHVTAAYAFSHSLDNISTDATFDSIPSRFLGRTADYASSDFDIRHTATIGLESALPIFSSSKLGKAFLSKWFVDVFEMIRSSPPIDVTLTREIGMGSYAFRPDFVAGAPKYLDDPTSPGGKRINAFALAVPETVRQGDLGRNSFRGFGLFQTDLAIRRRFDIKSGMALEIRGEAFNLFNHTNFAPELNQFGSVDLLGRFAPQSGFGVSQSTMGEALQGGSLGSGFNSLYQIGAARSLQFALKLQF